MSSSRNVFVDAESHPTSPSSRRGAPPKPPPQRRGVFAPVSKVEVQRGVTPHAIVFLHNRVKLVISRGSVVSFEGDAIINAANVTCVGGGGGADGSVTQKGGKALREARWNLPIVRRLGKFDIRCETGDAKLTIGGELKVPYCIHAVGPDYRKLGQSRNFAKYDALLESAYRKAMQLAKSKQCVALPLLFPLSLSLPLSLLLSLSKQ